MIGDRYKKSNHRYLITYTCRTVLRGLWSRSCYSYFNCNYGGIVRQLSTKRWKRCYFILWLELSCSFQMPDRCFREYVWHGTQLVKALSKTPRYDDISMLLSLCLLWVMEVLWMYYGCVINVWWMCYECVMDVLWRYYGCVMNVLWMLCYECVMDVMDALGMC